MFWFKKKEQEKVVLPVEIKGNTQYSIYQFGRYMGFIYLTSGNNQWEFRAFPKVTMKQATIEAIFNKLAELNLNEVSNP